MKLPETYLFRLIDSGCMASEEKLNELINLFNYSVNVSFDNNDDFDDLLKIDYSLENLKKEIEPTINKLFIDCKIGYSWNLGDGLLNVIILISANKLQNLPIVFEIKTDLKV